MRVNPTQPAPTAVPLTPPKPAAAKATPRPEAPKAPVDQVQISNDARVAAAGDHDGDGDGK